MTQEEKARAYDEALKRAKALIAGETNTSDTLFYLNDIKSIFPELQESEDEKIREQIISFIEEYGNPAHCEWQKEWIAWLEKQGDNPADVGLAELGKIWEEKVKSKWTDEDECYMSECISAIATKDGWSFEEKRKTKHWLEQLKQRMQ